MSLVATSMAALKKQQSPFLKWALAVSHLNDYLVIIQYSGSECGFYLNIAIYQLFMMASLLNIDCYPPCYPPLGEVAYFVAKWG
ncbi:hypothetical protein BZG13_06400 [Salinivibrio sp. ML323]|nr:hypothetical protein BZG13_06400 [Salinivibrio sp. ML323]